ncbi:LysR family transcriptional regulator [Paraburkholderia sp. BL23I1N1]|uniref:LysR family transcriptional regulator n=1 Tax=Paraburkholderia sp. BL23I1N1 TaxID=1938802 RepID=UPI000E766428|nr:LysR substrate-binding domain-containing protein [Paraburkholderia sp. BL23I1N1]RKE38571.1 LysR family transcriptional regulator [Paraburkholderia sp. BL23I1N1]
MKLQSLHEFLAVADRGSLRAAARHLGTGQPAISRSIRELERELGVVLFERSAAGVRLTSMGETFLRRASAVRTELQRAKEELDQMRGETHGHVTLACSSVPHLALLPDSLRPFRRRFPGVKLNVIDSVFPGIELRLRDGTVDFYVGPVPKDVSGELAVVKLFDNIRVIVGRKGHPLANAGTLRNLVDAEWITTSITHKAEEELGPLFAEHGLPAPRLVMQAHSALTFLVAMASSELLMMLPIQWPNATLWKDVLQVIPVSEVLPAPPICLVYRHGLPLTPAASHLCDLIQRAAHHLATQ